MKIETKVLHSGYKPENGGPGTIPIVQSTTYRFDSCDHVAALFDKPTEFMYSRFANPTCDAVEKKIADLEGQETALLLLLQSTVEQSTFLVLLLKNLASNVSGLMLMLRMRKSARLSNRIQSVFLAKQLQTRLLQFLILMFGQKLLTTTIFLLL